MCEKNLQEIVTPILKWYEKNKRSLPWRENGTPYAIWVSEIMLQQTRIETVKKYYERFLQEFPTITDLAQAEEERLLKVWEGLGYYSRVRNMQKAAKMMVEQYHKEMPKTYTELLSLPGIGEYTAGAIASIAYQEKVPCVDGNVLRVLSRYMGSYENILLPEVKKEYTQALIPILPKDVGNFNEGLMELGELVCIPNAEPLCSSCPLKSKCYAHCQNVTSELPIREKKNSRKKEERTVVLFLCDGKVAIQKRNSEGLLAGMYEFPNKINYLKQEELISLFYEGKITREKIKKIEKIGEATHLFSHIEWDMLGYAIWLEEPIEGITWVTKEELKKQYALPSAFTFFKNWFFQLEDKGHV